MKLQLIEQSVIKDDEIDLTKVESLFNQVKLILSDEIVNHYKQVLAFNEHISRDRNKYLLEEKAEITVKLLEIDAQLKERNTSRKELLSVLTETDSFKKFKVIEEEIVDLKTKINMAESHFVSLRCLKIKIRKKKILEGRRSKLTKELNVSLKKNKQLAAIKDTFKELSKMVFNSEAILTVTLNSNENLEFNTKIVDLNTDIENSKEDGEAYGRMFSFIFDSVIALTYKEENFFRFVAHDGLFDNLGGKYKQGIQDIVQLLIDEGIQYIFTSIEDEISESYLPLCKSGYLVAELSDSEQKRLFRMNSF